VCRIRDVEHLKEVLQTCWEQIGQDVIYCAIGQFCKRLSLVVATSGGHIEYRFDWCSWCYMYIIILTCFVLEIQKLDNKSTVNSPVYSAPPCFSSKVIYTHYERSSLVTFAKFNMQKNSTALNITFCATLYST